MESNDDKDHRKKVKIDPKVKEEKETKEESKKPPIELIWKDECPYTHLIVHYACMYQDDPCVYVHTFKNDKSSLFLTRYNVFLNIEHHLKGSVVDYPESCEGLRWMCEMIDACESKLQAPKGFEEFVWPKSLKEGEDEEDQRFYFVHGTPVECSGHIRFFVLSTC